MIIFKIRKYIYNKKIHIISTCLIMLLIFIFFPDVISSENPEIVGLEYDYFIATEEITEKTLIPMQQFTDRTGLSIDRFAEDYFILRLEGRHMLVISGEKKVRSNDEVYEVETAPVKVNDDILIPLKLAKSFLENDALDLLDKNEIKDTEERSGMQLVLSPETREISRDDSFEVEVKLKNLTEKTASFTFKTGQKFELELLDDEGSVVFKWSRSKIFTQVIEKIELEPGEVRSWKAWVITIGLRSGKYRLEGWLTDQRESLTAEPVEIKIK